MSHRHLSNFLVCINNVLLLRYIKNDDKKDCKYKMDKVDDLDIVLFRGEGYWFSYVVEWLTWSRFSHVGIILKDPIYIDPSLTGTYLLESGIEIIKDAEDDKCKFGVQITDFTQIYEGYTGEIWKRSLKPYEKKEVIQELLEKAHDVVHNKPYDTRLIDLVKIDLEKKWRNYQRTNCFVCSALVSFILVSLDLLDGKTNWDIVQPKDFDTGKWIEKNIKNCDFGELTKIK